MVKGIIEQKQVVEKDHIMLEKPLQVDIYDDFESLHVIQEQWDRLVESVGGEIFLSFDWCRIWWKYYGRDRLLRIYIFHVDDELVGVVPMFFEKIRLGPVSINAGKIVGSDFTLIQYCPPISADYIEVVIKKFSELLKSEKWDVVHIGPIAGLYKYFDSLKAALEKSFKQSCSVVDRQNSEQTYFELADSWEDHLTTIRKNERGNIRRNYNYLRKNLCNKTGIETSFADSDNLDDYFNEFLKMHETHWNTLGKGGHFTDWPDAEQFHREQARTHLEHGRLRLLKISLGGDCLGYQYHYKFGDKYLHFLDSRTKLPSQEGISPGRITFCEQVKKAIEEKVRYIDSMRGRYEHKLRIGGKMYPIRSLFIYPNSQLTKIRLSIFKFMTRILNAFYYKLWFCRLAPRLMSRHKPLWKIWIKTNTLV